MALFYMHPNKSLSLLLISMPLFGSNFHSWQHIMKMSLLIKNKIGFVDGLIQEPNQQDATYPYKSRCNTRSRLDHMIS